MEDRYDVMITTPMGRLGYVFDLTAQPYIKVDNTAPTLTYRTLTVANIPYSAADQDPPYPLSFNDFRDGAGQWNLDTTEAVVGAYWDSRNLDPSFTDQLSLGPNHYDFHHLWPAPASISCMAGGADGHSHLWAAFNNNGDWTDGGDYQQPLKRLTRFDPVLQYGAQNAASTTFILASDAFREYAINPRTMEVIYFPDAAPAPAGSATVTVDGVATQVPLYTYTGVARGSSDTAAQDTLDQDEWWGYQWDDADFSGTISTGAMLVPTGEILAMCSDGHSLFVSFASSEDSTGAFVNGGVWKGCSAGGDSVDFEPFVPFSDSDCIIDMCFCDGFLYGVYQDENDNFHAGYFAEPDAGGLYIYTQVEIDGQVWPNCVSRGMVRDGTYVYWLMTGESQSFVYMLQYSTGGSTWQLAGELPRGFFGTCIIEYTGSLYIGGYIITGDLYDSTPNADAKIDGAVYTMPSGTDLANLFTIEGDVPADTSVWALTGWNRFICALTTDGIWRYDLDKGSFHHYADCPVVTASSTSVVEGMALPTLAPSALIRNDTITYGKKVGKKIVGRQSLPIAAAGATAPAAGWHFYAKPSPGNASAARKPKRAKVAGNWQQYKLSVKSKPYFWRELATGKNDYGVWYIDDATLTSQGSIAIDLNYLFGNQAAEFGINLGAGRIAARIKANYQYRVKIAATKKKKAHYVTKTSAKPVNYHVFVASYVGGAIVWPTTPTTVQKPNKDLYLTLTISTTGGVTLAVGKQGAAIYTQADPTHLLPVGSGSYNSPNRVWFSVGWPDAAGETSFLGDQFAIKHVGYASAVLVPGTTGHTIAMLSNPSTLNADDGRFYAITPGDLQNPGALTVVDPRLQSALGSMRTSITSIRTGTRAKHYHSASCFHAPFVDSNQSIELQVWVDGTLVSDFIDSLAGTVPATADNTNDQDLIAAYTAGATTGPYGPYVQKGYQGDFDITNMPPHGALTTEIPVGYTGCFVQPRIYLHDLVPYRQGLDYNQAFQPGRLRAQDLTVFFNVITTGPLWTFVFDCTEKAQDRLGNPYDVDPTEAIATLFAGQGSLCEFETRYGGIQQKFQGYMEGAIESGVRLDPTKQARNRGKVQVTVRGITTVLT